MTVENILIVGYVGQFLLIISKYLYYSFLYFACTVVIRTLGRKECNNNCLFELGFLCVLPKWID